jgi:hypothetical protein
MMFFGYVIHSNFNHIYPGLSNSVKVKPHRGDRLVESKKFKCLQSPVGAIDQMRRNVYEKNLSPLWGLIPNNIIVSTNLSPRWGYKQGFEYDLC